MSGAKSIYINDADKAQLSEIFGGVIENLQKETLSQQFKSTNYTGDIKAGTAKFKRFVNAESAVYGTARGAGKGEKIKAPETPVTLDVHREIVEEVALSDVDLFGVPSLVERRKKNHLSSMQRELDRAFFNAAYTSGNAVTHETDALAKVRFENGVLKLEKTKNDYVDGVDRELMVAFVSPSFYSELGDDLDKLPTNKTDVSEVGVKIYKNVRIFSTTRLPEGVEYIVMAEESIAQPVISYPYDAEKIPLSNDVAIELFYDYGTYALTPDLIFYSMENGGAEAATVNSDDVSELALLTVTSEAGATAGETKITVNGASEDATRKLVYKVNTSSAAAVTYDKILTTGWTDLPEDGVIEATNGNVITVAEVTVADSKAVGCGSATIVAAE